jgi:DNA-directed RNA polymerase specialized sigma subunit
MNPFSQYKIPGATRKIYSVKQEIALIRAWKKRKDHASRDALISNYILFTLKTARALYSELSEEDSLTLAHSSILDAINRFNLDKYKTSRLSNLIPFSVQICMRKKLREDELVHGPYQERGRKRTLSLNAGVCPEAIESVLRQQSELDLGDEENPLIRKDITAKIHEALNLLPRNQKVLLRELFFKERTLADVGRDNRKPVTREAVRQRRLKALLMLKDALRKVGLSEEDCRLY